MGKRKNQQKLLDPILPEKLKRVKIISKEEKELMEAQQKKELLQKQLEEEENINSSDVEISDQDEEIQEEEEKNNYEKFLEVINHKQNQEIQNQETKKVLKNLIKIPILQTQNLEVDPLFSHFNFDHEKLETDKIIEEKIIYKQKKKSAKEQIREKMMEIFDVKIKSKDNDNNFISNTQQKEEELYKIKIKDFDLNQELKQKNLNYQIDNYQQFQLNNLSKNKYSQGINGNCDIFVNEKLKNQVPIFKQQQNFIEYGYYSIMKNYSDLVFVDPMEENCEKFRKQYVTHILNHILKSQELDKQNEQEDELKDKKEKQIKINNNNVNEEEENNQLKNKGYTRCKVLILTPFRGDANVIVKQIIQQYTQKEGISKTSFKQRYEEYYEDPDKQLDDEFRLGISLTKGKAIKLFSSFEHSDIIIASPLGLRLKIGALGDKDREFSFLSSIECLVLDRAQTIYMQNLNHLEEILDVINRIPKHQKMTNSIDQIRPYYFDNKAKFYRQNIVYTECNFPELNSIRNRFFFNFEGYFQNKPFYQPIFNENDLVFNQEFCKIEIQNLQNEQEERFQYFKSKVWEKWRNVDNAVIFCSSYFEYLKLKDYFIKINGSFQGCCEYTKKNRIQSRFAMWKQKQFRTILFSERAQFFDLWALKNHQHILFYSLPKNAEIYQDILQNIDKPNPKSKVQCLFTQYDNIYLEKIIGSKNAKEFMAQYNKNTNFIL